MSDYLSAEAAYGALQNAVDKFRRIAPENHDIVIEAFNILVTKVEYIEPYILSLRGFNHEGNDTLVVTHFTQLVARIVHVPKCVKRDRIITGFAKSNGA